MITYGFAKQYMYSGDGTLLVQVRIPSIHGPYVQTNANGQTLRNYVVDTDLPWYQSLLLPHLPNDGEVVALLSTDNAYNQMIVIGLTGGSYYSGVTNLEV